MRFMNESVGAISCAPNRVYSVNIEHFESEISDIFFFKNGTHLTSNESYVSVDNVLPRARQAATQCEKDV